MFESSHNRIIGVIYLGNGLGISQTPSVTFSVQKHFLLT
jgi:hypothetical protein